MAFYRSGVIERALAVVFRVKADQMSVFHGRLRHLRNIDCPKLPKTGSGQPLWITREQAIEMLIALELTTLGIAPRHAVEPAKFYAEHISDPNWDVRGDYLIISPIEEFSDNPTDPGLGVLHFADRAQPGFRAYAGPGMMSSLQKASPQLIERFLAGGSFAVVNVAKSVALLDRAIHNASVSGAEAGTLEGVGAVPPARGKTDPVRAKRGRGAPPDAQA